MTDQRDSLSKVNRISTTKQKESPNNSGAPGTQSTSSGLCRLETSTRQSTRTLSQDTPRRSKLTVLALTADSINVHHHHHQTYAKIKNLEAFPVDNSGSAVVILVLGDPHFLECAQGTEDRSSNPHRVFAFRRGHDLHLDAGRGQSSHLLGQPHVNVGEHGGASRQDSVGVQVPSNVHIALHDRLVGQLVDALALLSNQVRLEQHPH